MLGMGVVAPFLPEYSLSLGASATEVGLIFSSFSISRTFVLPFIGNLSDRKNKKSIILVGLVLYMVVSWVYLCFKSLQGLFLARFLQGISAGLVIPSSMALLGEIAPKEELGKFTGLYNTAFFLGLGAGPLIGGMLKGKTGMKGPFAIMGFLALASFVLSYLYLPDGKIHKISKGSLISFFEKLKKRSIIRLITFRITYSIGIGLTWTFVPLRLKTEGLSDAWIGALVSWIIFFSSIVQTPMGYLSDRYDKKKLVFLGGLLNSFSFFIFPKLASFFWIFVVFSLMGLSGGLSLPSFNALCVEEGGEKEIGLVMNIVTFFHSLGMVMGPIAAGIITDIWGINTPFFWGSSISAIGSFVFYFL